MEKEKRILSYNLKALYRTVRRQIVYRLKCSECHSLNRYGKLCKNYFDHRNKRRAHSLNPIFIDRTLWLILADAIEEEQSQALAEAWRWLAKRPAWMWPEPKQGIGLGVLRFGWRPYPNRFRERQIVHKLDGAFISFLRDTKTPDGSTRVYHVGSAKSEFGAFVRLAQTIVKIRPKEVYGNDG